MLLLDGQARSEDSYVWAEEPWVWVCCTPLLSCSSAWANNGTAPPLHKDKSILCPTLGSFWRRDSSNQKMLGGKLSFQAFLAHLHSFEVGFHFQAPLSTKTF